MGNISFFVALSVAGVLALASGRHFSWRVAAFLGSLFLVDALILGNWVGFEKLAQRIQDTDVATEQRVASSEYALDMAADFPWTGSGGGTFYGLFPNYQSEPLDGFHTHAHNDYLQFAAELGLPAALLLACFCVLGLWHGWRVQKDRHQPLYRGAGFAVVMSTVWLALHATADFNLQIPANALVFVILLSLGPICRALPGKTG
jgi:O-antigen ligase